MRLLVFVVYLARETASWPRFRPWTKENGLMCGVVLLDYQGCYCVLIQCSAVLKNPQGA